MVKLPIPVYRRLYRMVLALGLGAVFLGVGTLPPTAQVWAAEPALGLSALLERAEAQNPDLKAARLRWEAAQAKSGYAGALDAPRLQASLMDVFTLGGPSVMVTQMLPGGSKRALMTEAAQREAAMDEAEYAQQRLQVTSDLRQAYYEHVYLNRAQAIYRQTLEQVRNLRKIADAKYAVGAGTQQDPIRAQREVSKWLDKGLMLDAELDSSLAWINTLANRQAMAQVQVPKDLPAMPPMSKAENLLAKAESNSPSLKAFQARVEAQAAKLELARQEKRTPDYEIGVEAGRSMPGDMVYIGGMVGINLPWLSQGRYESAIQEAEASLAAAQAAYQAEKNRLRGEIYRMLAELKRQESQVQLYKQGLLPQATQSLQAALAAYQVNKVDFDTVLESQTAIYQVQTDEARARADYHKVLAKLEALIGTPISALATK